MDKADTDTPQVGPTEPSMTGQWSVCESFLAVLISNAPMFFPLPKRWLYDITNMTSSSQQNSSYPLAEIDTKRTGGSSTKKSRKGSNTVYPLSIPNNTAWGNDEAIVVTSGEVEKEREKGSVEEEERRSR
jgi:hypothetical protein